MIRFSHIVDAMATDALAPCVARASANMAITKFAGIFRFHHVNG